MNVGAVCSEAMVSQVVSDIVTFAHPPVVEVVAGVAFDGLGAEAGALLAAFWKEHLRQQFPSLQQQPPYFPPDEQFPVEARASGVNLSFGVPPVVRLWAQSSDGQELLQLQPGWFACNWRKVQPEGTYDRWRNRRQSFQRHFQALSDYISAEGMGQLKVRQCEVTYINHIAPSASWSRHDKFFDVFTVSLQGDVPHPFEQMAIQAQSILIRDDEPYGRLYTKIFPAFGMDGKTPLYVFELTARGAPQGEGVEGALAFLDLGREAIDRTFFALTTQPVHGDWGFEP